MRIVYVEDNEANVFLVRRIASAGNHELLTYTTAEEALANFEEDAPHMLLVDMKLAGKMQGLEMVQLVREAGYDLPIIAITAYASPGERQSYLDAGFDDFIIKPAPVNRLVALLGA